jgi:hypothetical protein
LHSLECVLYQTLGPLAGQAEGYAVVDVNTTVFNKQLEELESLADSTGLYDDQQDDDEEEVQAEPSMEWRRATLEESYSRVKRAKGRPVDPNRVYEIGTLLFEPAEGKFGRVKRSVPGYLCIQFLRGGEREYGRRPDVEAYLRENHRGKTATELASQLGLTETEVQGHLNRLGLVRVDVIPSVENPAAHDAEDRKDAKKGAKHTRAKDGIPGMSADDIPGIELPNKPTKPKPGTHPEKALGKLPPSGKPLEKNSKDAITADPGKGKTGVPAKSSAPKAVAAKSTVPTTTQTKSALPKAALKSTVPPKANTKQAKPAVKSTPPTRVGDSPKKDPKAAAKPGVKPKEGTKNSSKAALRPGASKGMTPEQVNEFIMKHYKEFSNRDLASKTGLSENTVRRKLGEWKLRRTKE